MKGLSKSRLLAHRQCPKQLWLRTYRSDLAEEDEGVTSRLETGSRVGEIARTLYEGAWLIEGDTLTQSLDLTQQALQTLPELPLCEATFEHDRVLIRADILVPERNGYDLVEVKSSTTVKDYHYADAAVQAWVVRGAGVPLSRVEVAHIDNTFVYPGGGDYRGLLNHADITGDANVLALEVPGWAESARLTLAGDEPAIEPGEQCSAPFDCPFIEYCSPASPEDAGVYPPEILPYGRRVAEALRADGYDDLRDVPEGYLDNPRHERIRHASVTGQSVLDPQAGKILEQYSHPYYFLDFETIQFAIPVWAGTRPYQQIPFQWSCHREARNGDLQSGAFLARDDGDPRRAFVDSLLAFIGPSGPIFVYNIGFERTRLQELIEVFPEMEELLDAVCDRMVDLLPIAREHYYHPAMRGSWSIKAVLPTVAPDLSYTDLEVGDGGMAQDAYLEMIRPETSTHRHDELREGLLIYCGLDTLALVRLARYFKGH